jgi:hypothetical protein
MSALWRDLRQAARALRSNPGLVALATLSLALGIGANVTVYTWARATLLEPFPGVRDQGRLVKVVQTDPQQEFVSFSHPDYRDLRDQAKTVSGLVALRQTAATLGADGTSERAWVQMVSGNFFEVLGVEAALGRTLSPTDDLVPEGHPVVVIGHALWQRRFGGDPGVVGRTVLMNSALHRRRRRPPAAAPALGLVFDAWVPMMMHMQFEPGGSRLEQRGHRWLEVYAPRAGRLRAQAELDVLSQRASPRRPARYARRGVALFPLWRAPHRGRDPRARSSWCSAASARWCCCSPAPTSRAALARGVNRRRRSRSASLGARRGDVRASCSSRACCSRSWAAWPGLRGLLRDRPAEAGAPPTPFPLSIGRRSTARRSVSRLAWRSDRAAVRPRAGALRRPAERPTRCATRPPHVRAAARAARRPVVAQVALSVLLLVAAGLFLRTLQRLQSTDLGFEPERRASDVAGAVHERLRPRARLRVLP